MDLKPLDLVWVDGFSTSWSHPGELPDFQDIPGLAIVSDSRPVRKKPLLSQVSLPAHRLPPSEFDPAPTLALHIRQHDRLQDRSIALQLSLFPSAVYCHVPGGDKGWKSALQMEREIFGNGIGQRVARLGDEIGIPPVSGSDQRESSMRRARIVSRPVICEFRRSSGIVPQLSKYMKPSGRNMIIRFLQDDDIDKPGR